MTGRLRDLTVNRDGTQNITITVPVDFGPQFEKLKAETVNVEIKKASKSRSTDANAYCWALCSDIGKALTPPLAKEDVYRMAIKAVGVYTQTMLIAWDVDTVRKRWESHGTGWFLEVVDDAGLVGHKVVNLYYGSSTYTVDEMRLVNDWLTDQAQQIGIAIPLSKDDAERMYAQWAKNKNHS